MNEQYFDYEGVPVVQKDGEYLRYGKDGQLHEYSPSNPLNLNPIKKESFDNWIKNGSYEEKANDEVYSLNKLPPYLF